MHVSPVFTTIELPSLVFASRLVFPIGLNHFWRNYSGTWRTT